jgi:Uncharacterized protein conserved in bacteria, putative lipoprotein
MKITGVSIFVLMALGVSYQTNAASFDCGKAKSFAEKTICNDEKLSTADDELKYTYGKAKASVQDRRAFSEITKTLWNSRERCSNYACVNSWYDTAFGIYSSIAKTGIPEANGQNDIVADDEKLMIHRSALAIKKVALRLLTQKSHINLKMKLNLLAL